MSRYEKPPIAGYVGKNQMLEQNAKDCLSFPERPITPEHIKKYRKSYFEPVGSHIVSPSQIEDMERAKKQQCQLIFGMTKEQRQHQGNPETNEVLPNRKLTQYESVMEERKEMIYAFSKHEPLGRAPSSTYGKEYDTSYSKKIQEYQEKVSNIHKIDGLNTKELLYPTKMNMMDSEKLPGKGKEWNPPASSKIDLSTYRFGKNINKTNNNNIEEDMKTILGPDQIRYEQQQVNEKEEKIDNLPKTIVAKSLQSMKMLQDNIGKVRLIGQNEDLKLNENKIVNSMEDHVGECLRMPMIDHDEDLGKPVHTGWKNENLNDNFTFGIPSGSNAIMTKEILYPDVYAERGILDHEFYKIRNKDELYEIYKEIHETLSLEDFDEVYTKASQLTLFTNEGEVCIEDLRYIINDMIQKRKRKERI